MNPLAIADEVWARLSPRLQRLQERITERKPSVTCVLGHHSTEVFPLTGYASISSSGDPAEENVVVSIGCRLEAGVLECSADIATGKGAIVADGPTEAIDLCLGDVLVRRRLDVWVRAVGSFLDDNHATVLAALDAEE